LNKIIINTQTVDVDVDTGKDFILSSGALPVPDGEEIIENTRLLTADACRKNRLIISLVDRHFNNELDREELKTYGFHCMDGTPGQEKISESLLTNRFYVPSFAINLGTLRNTVNYHQVIFGKQDVNGFYSKTNLGGNRNLEIAVRDVYRVKKAFFRGVCTDICVVINLFEFIRLEVECYLVTDAIRALDSKAGEQAVKRMEKEGVKLVTTEWVLENV